MKLGYTMWFGPCHINCPVLVNVVFCDMLMAELARYSYYSTTHSMWESNYDCFWVVFKFSGHFVLSGAYAVLYPRLPRVPEE